MHLFKFMNVAYLIFLYFFYISGDLLAYFLKYFSIKNKIFFIVHKNDLSLLVNSCKVFFKKKYFFHEEGLLIKIKLFYLQLNIS